MSVNIKEHLKYQNAFDIYVNNDTIYKNIILLIKQV